MLLAPRVAAQAKDPFLVKAAFLGNFAKYAEWPASAFRDSKGPLVIGVIGDDPFGPRLDTTVKGMEIHGHPVVVRRFGSMPSPGECHLLFAGAEAARRLPELVAASTAGAVLLVGERRGFAEEGGMIGFVERDGAIHFEVNLASANAAGLKLNSGLLKLADQVYKTAPKTKP
jgi:hypothetical protein